MRLRRLELFGFKSFADRAVLDFEHDFTGIVGPNGCGKSNVVDAIRWVLGEQRPTSMRSGEMVDVIFKGSVSRPAMAVAEATMVLDNREGTIDERGLEIAITRRVYGSGEGEYLIDGDRVRLKDVRDMLFGTGLGSRGYSVLEQGKIDAVLSANALDRRAIFEEAAGISRYRQRRKETESRLKRVEADLLRLDDIVRELERRERSLKIQAGRARRFIEARDAWRIDGLRLAQHQVHGLEERIEETTTALTACEEGAAELRERRASFDADVTTREREQDALAAEVERLASESSDLAGEVRALDERRRQLLSRVDAWERDSEEERERAEGLRERLAARRRERVELLGVLGELEEEAAQANRRQRELTDALREKRSGHVRAREETKKQNERVLALLHERTSGRNRVQHLEGSLAPLDERTRRGEERRREADENAGAARQSQTEAAAELERRRERGDVLDAERSELDGELTGHETRRGELEREHSELELECARFQSRVEALLDWEREREKLEGGARVLLDAVEKQEGPALGGRISGLFADHLRTDVRHARALDAVLGLRAQALVVESREDARSIVAWLKSREEGRLHLVLPEGFAHTTTVEVPEALLAAEGVDGRLLDVAHCDDKFTALARALLGDVVLVRDADRALELVGEYPRLRFATPEGDMIEAGGLVGGHTETVQGAVGRRSFAAELERRREATLERRERTARELEEVRGEVERLTGLRAELMARIEQESEARARARGAAEAAQARLADLDRVAELARHECEGLAREQARLGEELTGARDALAAAERAFEEENSALGETDTLRRTLEADVEELARDEGRVRAQAAGVGERLGGARRRDQDLERTLREAREELERTERQSTEHAESARGGREESERLALESGEALERRGELEERLVELRVQERAGREGIEKLRRGGEELTGELEGLLAQESDRRLEKQRLELSHDEIRRRAEEDFSLEPHALLEQFTLDSELASEEAIGALAEAVGELKAQMEKLGPVNLEAVHEVEEVSERLGFLQAQRRDLADARRTLAGTIEKLNLESRRLFTETFEEVRDQFRTIFRQLFGGGRADIRLEGDEDVLEAGIEITARPPGRETLPISLLSGGQRTLTALALLFAVFRSRPSPFCVLDEVDAALDDANIGRFLALLRYSLGETQFIVVTHNKGTMAASDVLYGVTMAVRGVSHVVSVELADVDEFVPEAKGGKKKGRNQEDGAEADAKPEMIPAPPDPIPVQVPEPKIAGGNGREGGGDEEPIVEIIPPPPVPAPIPEVAEDSPEVAEDSPEEKGEDVTVLEASEPEESDPEEPGGNGHDVEDPDEPVVELVPQPRREAPGTVEDRTESPVDDEEPEPAESEPETESAGLPQ